MANEAQNMGMNNLPLGDLVRSLANAVVEAQMGLDQNAMRVAEMMSGSHVLRDPATDLPLTTVGTGGETVVQTVDSRVFFGSTMQGGQRIPTRLSMMELGFTPTFYQFVETTIDVKIALRVTSQRDETGTTTVSLSGTPVDAHYSQSYGYSADAACTFRTRLVPIPAPPLLERRLEQLLAAQNTPAAPKKARATKAKK